MRPEPSFDSWTKGGEAPTGREMHHQKPHSAAGWHSPVPYLFGGLAAMLGLIAFALLILACSYWKLSGYLDNAENTEETGDQAAEVKQEVKDVSQSQYYSEVRLVVIMAGEEKPTFLATPISSKSTSSFGEGNNRNNVVVREEKMERQSGDDQGDQRQEYLEP